MKFYAKVRESLSFPQTCRDFSDFVPQTFFGTLSMLLVANSHALYTC